MINQDDNQDIYEDSEEYSDELVEDEGGQVTIDDDSDESVDDQYEEQPRVAKKTPLDGIIEKQAMLYAEADEYEREEILNRFPKIKSKVQALGNSLIEEINPVQQNEDDIAMRAAAILEKKQNADKVKNILVKKGIRGKENLEKLQKAAEKLIESGFTSEQSISAVLATTNPKSHPMVQGGVRRTAEKKNAPSAFGNIETLDSFVARIKSRK